MAKPSTLEISRTRTRTRIRIALLFKTKLLAFVLMILCNVDPLRAGQLVTDEIGPDANRWNIQAAIDRARDFFNNSRGQTGLTYEIVLPNKWITISPKWNDQKLNSIGLLRFDNIKPGQGNKLLVRGTGRYFNENCQCEMSNTTLAFPWNHTNISGTNSSNIEFNNIHFTKNRIKVTQGIVQRIGTDHIVVKLEEGFPTLAPSKFGGICKPRDENDASYSTKHLCSYPEINGDKGHGKKIRKYELVSDPASPGGFNPVYLRPPKRIKGGVEWYKAEKDFSPGAHPQDWKVYILPIENIQYFEEDDPVGIKSKHGQHAYYFERGALTQGGQNKASQGITFANVQWTQEARGIFRGVHQVNIQNSYAGPDPYLNNRLGRTDAVSYLSTSSGGPQIGSHDDYPANFDWNKYHPRVRGKFGGSWHVIYNNNFVRLGDDAIGLFHVGKRNYVLKNRIVDGPARSVLMLNRCNFKPDVVFKEDNEFINSVYPEIEEIYNYDNVVPPLHDRGVAYSRQRCDLWKADLGL